MVLSRGKRNKGKTIFRVAVAFVSVGLLLSSCLTTGGNVENNKGEEVDKSEKNVEKKEKDKPLQEESEVQKERDKAVAEFMKLLSDTDIRVTSSPSATMKNQSFSSPYIVTVSHADGTKAPSFPIMATYPARRDGDTISFDTVKLETNSEGVATFTPDIPHYSFDSTVTFTPIPPIQDASLGSACQEVAVSAQYRVRTNMVNDGGMIYVWDYNENNVPLVNDAPLLKEIMAFGVHNVGNAPFASASQLSKSDADLYQAARVYVQKGFMIYGTVKYAAPPLTGANGKVTCSLVANLKCMDLRSGKVLYVTEQHCEASGANKASAVDACRKQMAKIAARAVMYGM